MFEFLLKRIHRFRTQVYRVFCRLKIRSFPSTLCDKFQNQVIAKNRPERFQKIVRQTAAVTGRFMKDSALTIESMRFAKFRKKSGGFPVAK